MRPFALAAEFAACQAAMTDRHRARLKSLGVEGWVLDPRCPLVGAGRVSFDGPRFQLTPDGQAAVIIAARGDDAPLSLDHESPVRAATMGAMVLDLIAFTTTAPARWATRCGAVDALGYAPAQLLAPRVEAWIYPTPLQWLAAGCDGLVILTAEPLRIRDILMSGSTWLTEDQLLRSRLQRIAERPLPVPPIRVMTRDAWFDELAGEALALTQGAA